MHSGLLFTNVGFYDTKQISFHNNKNQVQGIKYSVGERYCTDIVAFY